MKEIDLTIPDDKLALYWFEQALYSVDNLNDVIEFNNYRYGFNLYDNNEELSSELLKYKMAVKYKNICLPLMSAIEEALKAVLIRGSYQDNPNNFNRNEVVFNIMKAVRKEENANGHDIFALMNYINNHYDRKFITYIANEYAYIRDRKEFVNNELSPRSTIRFDTNEERIEAATREYAQGFIEFRYLYEKGESYVRNVDLTKIMQYGMAILEVVRQRLGLDSIYYDTEDLIPKNDFGREMIGYKIEREREARLKEIEEKGFLPVNSVYHTRSLYEENLPYLVLVEKYPKEYIIEECIPACMELFEKNISIFSTSDYHTEEGCFIDIHIDLLSEENKAVISTLPGFEEQEDKSIFRLKSSKVGKEGQEELLNLVKQFQMQDVSEKIAYVSVQSFLVDYCNCYDEVANPNYKSINYSEVLYALLEGKSMDVPEEEPKVLKVFNPDKVTKPVEELVHDHKMILDGDRVYLSDFYYQKHMKYVESLNSSKKSSK